MRECSSSVPVKCIRLPARHFANLNALSLTVHDLVLVSLFKGEDEADGIYSDRTTSKHGTKECRWSGTTSEPEERDRAQTTDGQLSKHQTRPRSRAIGDSHQNITLRRQCHHREVNTDKRIAMTAPFIPRTVFPLLDSIPRSYYLGHHAAGLSKMKTMLSQIDLIIECRDYRVPLTSHNPLFEDALAGRERMVVYTKKDLGRKGNGTEEDNKVRLLQRARTIGGENYGRIRRLICRNFCSEKRCFANGTILLRSCSQTSVLRAISRKCWSTSRPPTSRVTA